MICESLDRVPRDAALVRWFGPVGLAAVAHSAVRDLEIEHELATACGATRSVQAVGAGVEGERCYEASPVPAPRYASRTRAAMLAASSPARAGAPKSTEK